ncbi:MAG: shikimate dehydrogenase [Fimbriimonadaceae bacterium]|nr:shikimate dehydrogenase [Fimbriimonadaceae bacterium]
MSQIFAWRDAPPADFAVIGDPIGHSRSPQMHRAAYAALGMSYRYVAIQVPVGEVREALDSLTVKGYRGVNVTVPHKSEALAWARAPDELTSRIGAANTLELATGRATNTDAPGFLKTLADLNVKAGASILIFGAGGSARALAAVLPTAGYRVSIWNRTHSRARNLADEFSLNFLAEPVLDADVLVNTTSVGLQGNELPLDWKQARGGSLAYDLVYGRTPFLDNAAEWGLRTVDGKPLLAAQGSLSFEWWLGIKPPPGVMLEAIR